VAPQAGQPGVDERPPLRPHPGVEVGVQEQLDRLDHPGIMVAVTRLDHRTATAPPAPAATGPARDRLPRAHHHARRRRPDGARGMRPPRGDDGFRTAFAQEAASLGRFTVVVLGRTGVGKSTLVNAVFGESLAETGIGAPVTQTSHLYSREGVGLAVVDTKGIEIGEDTEELLADLRALVAHSRTRGEEEQIHVAWFCVQAADLRIQDGERAVIEELDGLGIPVLLVMTKVPQVDGRNHPDAVAFHHAVQAMRLPVVGGRAWPVMALGDSFAGWPAHGLRELSSRPASLPRRGSRRPFVAAQRVDPRQGEGGGKSRRRGRRPGRGSGGDADPVR
jgi:GTP-binding protein EngB required for normal cell division